MFTLFTKEQIKYAQEMLKESVLGSDYFDVSFDVKGWYTNIKTIGKNDISFTVNYTNHIEITDMICNGKSYTKEEELEYPNDIWCNNLLTKERVKMLFRVVAKNTSFLETLAVFLKLLIMANDLPNDITEKAYSKWYKDNFD
jgi:hypothetical protein